MCSAIAIPAPSPPTVREIRIVLRVAGQACMPPSGYVDNGSNAVSVLL